MSTVVTFVLVSADGVNVPTEDPITRIEDARTQLAASGSAVGIRKITITGEDVE